MKPVGFFFARNFTIEPLCEAFGALAREEGFEITAEIGSYANALTDLLEVASRPSPPEFVCVVLSLDFLNPGPYSPEWSFSEVEGQIDQILGVIDGLPPSTHAIIATFVSHPRCELPYRGRRHGAGFQGVRTY